MVEFHYRYENQSFRNPLHVAALNGDVAITAAFENSSVEIDQVENGRTPLHLAVIGGKKLAVRKLISMGANLSKMDEYGFAPLHLAVHHGHVSLIEDLINTNTDSDVDIFDRYGNTALHTAIKMGNIDAVRALHIGGADVDLPNRDGNSPLHLAVIHEESAVIDVLVKYVRNPNIFDRYRFRPLHLAVLYNRIAAIRKIGKIKGVKIHDFNRDGDGALHLATKLRNLEAMQALIDLKVNVNLKNSKGFSPMHLAVIYRKMNATKVLARIDEANRFKNPPIHVSAALKDISALGLLCSSKANVNIKNAYGDSILHSVIMTDCEDAVRMLLDLGAKLNVQNHFCGMTPLHAAVCFGNKAIIEMLLQHRASVFSKDFRGDMPIHSSAKFCSLVGIETLIKHGRNLVLKNRKGLTPSDIIMVYVREDTFGTAVQTVSDLYKEKYLKRRLPLSSHEILKCAKLIFKHEIFFNFENNKLNEPENLSDILPILRSYITDCFSEVKLIMSTLLKKELSLYSFVKNGWNKKMPLTRECTSEALLDHILNVSITKEYPIYLDVIVSNLERFSLLKKARFYRISMIQNGKTIFLDMYEIAKYLSNNDILNLLLAYSDLDPDTGVSKSSNVQKRKKSSDVQKRKKSSNVQKRRVAES